MKAICQEQTSRNTRTQACQFQECCSQSTKSQSSKKQIIKQFRKEQSKQITTMLAIRKSRMQQGNSKNARTKKASSQIARMPSTKRARRQVVNFYICLHPRNQETKQVKSQELSKQMSKNQAGQLQKCLELGRQKANMHTIRKRTV